MSPRRIRWAMRAVVYVPLVLLAVALLGMRGAESVVHLGFLEGRTSQADPVQVQFDDDDEVRVFRTTLRLRCTWGDEFTLSWTARRGEAGTVFARDGDRLTIREDWTERGERGHDARVALRLDGAVDGTRGASGRIDATIRWTWGARDAGTCSAAGVRWRARAG
jgi:hypothetical protein